MLRLKVEDGDEYVPNKMSVSKAPRVGRAVWWMMASRMGIDVRVWIGLMRCKLKQYQEAGQSEKKGHGTWKQLIGISRLKNLCHHLGGEMILV